MLSFWAISLIINDPTQGGREMMLKLIQASLAVLERGFSSETVKRSSNCVLGLSLDFDDWHIPLLLEITQR